MVEKNLRGIFLYRGNFFCFLYTTLACTHFCRLGTFGFLTTPPRTKYKRTGKHCSFTVITIIPYYTAKCQQLCKGESNTNWPLTVLITYNTVSAPSEISSRTAKISLPLFAFSKRNSAKLTVTNCVLLFDIIKLKLMYLSNTNLLETCCTGL